MTAEMPVMRTTVTEEGVKLGNSGLYGIIINLNWIGYSFNKYNYSEFANLPQY